MIFKERRILYRDDLRNLCIKKQWYTRGDCAEYENMLSMTGDGKKHITTSDIVAIAGDIMAHTDEPEYRLFRQRGIPAKVMPAGLRGVHHLTSMAGADIVFSLQARVQKMAIEADPERVCHADEDIPSEIIRELYKIPEFVRAYEEGGLKEEEFITFGVTQKTLSQFLWTGWVPLETYQAEASNRWF